MDRQYENRGWFYRLIEMDDAVNHIQIAETHYTNSWLSYVTAVWQMVRDGISAEARVREEALKKSRLEPEVPAHLKRFEGEQTA